MYDPKFRMAILICLIVFFYTVIQLVLAIINPESTFSVKPYLWGSFLIGGASFGGFIFIWGCVKYITFERSKAEKMTDGTLFDETGTGFNMPVHLNKFIPDIIAAPTLANAHPLEEELIGFLNGFRHWPTDLEDRNKPDLATASMQMWEAVQRVPHVDFPHRIAALASDLSKIYLFKESRKLYPIWMFWRPASVSFKKRCDEHAGYSTFILTTMPSFNKLERSVKQAILTAVRYKDTPTFMPTNASDLTKEIYEALHQAEAIIQNDNERSHAPTDAEKSSLHKEVADYLQSTIKALGIETTVVTSHTHAIYLGDGKLAFRLESFIQALLPSMSPVLRSAFKLWQYNGGSHPANPHFVQAFYNMGALVDKYNDIEARTGIFNLKIAGFPFERMVIIDTKRAGFLQLTRELERRPQLEAPVQVLRNLNDAIIMVRDRAAKMDTLLKKFRKGEVS